MFLVDIPQVAFLGPYRRVWREDLAPGTNVEASQAPSEVEGGSPSEVMVCATSEEMRGVCQYPGDGAVEG